ncbi:MAG: MerR family transcriptional regulator [Bauldia sp.]|nr:MerR family transcriptional regulator [Bauldia sp.]
MSMAAKSPEAFRTISEVADDLDLPQHVLRFWETRFAQIKPLKRGGGRRYYRPDDVDLLRGIRYLLYGEGYTIRGVQRILKEQGIRSVIGAGRGEFAGIPARQDRRSEAGSERRVGMPVDDDADGDVTEIAEAAEADVQAPAFADERRATPHPGDAVDREDHDPDEADGVVGDAGSARRMAERLMGARAPAAEPGLASEDAEALKATLMELLELKRMLDQAR